jgi:MFS family permease
VLLAGLMWTFYNGAFTAFLTYTPSLLAARGAPLWRTDLVMNLATWGNLPAILFGGVAAARFGAGRVMWLGTLATAAPLAAIGLGAPPVAWGALFGTVGALHAGVIVGVGTLSASPQHRAVGMALFYTAYYIGGTVFPALCGRAADLMGDPGGALLCGAVLGLLTLPVWSLHQRRMARAPA